MNELLKTIIMRRRMTQEISMGSMADIAFLLLIFFLVATTMDADKGIMRKLPPIVTSEPINFHERDILVVLINRDDKLMVEGKETDLRHLREIAMEFIVNPLNLNNLPELVEIQVNYFGKVRVTKKHVISLRSDRGTSYKMYIAVQNELVAAYNELREELAQKKWQTTFSSLTNDQKKAITTIYPMKISEAEPNY
jgi:biopolymer transport protein ExbD